MSNLRQSTPIQSKLKSKAPIILLTSTLLKMAGVERFELPTVGFGDRCSTNWNYTPSICTYTYRVILSCLGIKRDSRSEALLY
jgi:hypothetical protein